MTASGRWVEGREQNFLDGGSHFYGIYECSCGNFISIGSIEPQFYALLRQHAGLTDADLRAGHVSVVNVFGSWCEPCHFEHQYLMALAADPELKSKGVAIYGVAQKDSAENIRRFLGAKGDPYAKVGLDQDNRAGIDWGVYGVPETFIVKGDGKLVFKLVGPITAATLESEVKPQILKAMN